MLGFDFGAILVVSRQPMCLYIGIDEPKGTAIDPEGCRAYEDILKHE